MIAALALCFVTLGRHECTTSLAARPQSRAISEDTSGFPAVRALLDGIIRAARSADGEAMLRAYVQEAPISFSSHGRIIASRDSMAMQYRAWNPALMKGTSAEWLDMRLHAIGSDVVIVIGHLKLAFGTPSGVPGPPLTMSWSGVFERRKGRWGLAHEHESFAFKTP